MKKGHKKKFPKIKKSLKKFLTDESGKITKKDALGIAAGGILLSGIDEVGAGHTNNRSPSLPTNGTKVITYNAGVCNHVSGIVNGHISQTPDVSSTTATLHTHSNHSNHANHGDGGWC